MTKTIYTIAGQTIWDILVQEYGTLEAYRQLQEDNPAVVTDINVNLAPGTPITIQVASPAGVDPALRKILNDLNVIVNSQEPYVKPVGIGYMAIGTTNIIII
jgi:hypothetical protein